MDWNSNPDFLGFFNGLTIFFDNKQIKYYIFNKNVNINANAMTLTHPIENMQVFPNFRGKLDLLSRH